MIKKFECVLCNSTFALKKSLKQHDVSIHKGIKFQCQYCGKQAQEALEMRLMSRQ